MNERDFDNLFSKKLNEEGLYSNLDANWEKVRAKMASIKDSESQTTGVLALPNEGKKNQRWVVPTLISLSLLLLLSNGWLLWRLLDSRQGQSSDSQKYDGQKVYLKDTIIETKVIYKIDTIYKRIIVLPSHEQRLYTTIEENSIPYSAPSDNKIKINAVPTTPSNGINSSQLNKKQATAIEENPKKGGNKPDFSIKKIHSESISPTDTREGVSTQSEPKSLVDSSAFSSPSPKDSLTWTDSSDAKSTEKRGDIIKVNSKKIVIDHFAFGLQTGGAKTIPANIGMNPSFWLGIAGQVVFKKRLSLTTSIDRAFYHYKTTVRDPLLHIPNDPPMTENYKLKYVEGETTSLQVGIGLSYQLLTESRIKPYISANYINRWILPYEAEFEFTNLFTGEEKSFSVEEKSYHRDKWYALGLGLTTKLAPKIEAHLKGEFIYDGNHGQAPFKQILLRGGIFYRF